MGPRNLGCEADGWMAHLAEEPSLPARGPSPMTRTAARKPQAFAVFREFQPTVRGVPTLRPTTVPSMRHSGYCHCVPPVVVRDAGGEISSDQTCNFGPTVNNVHHWMRSQRRKARRVRRGRGAPGGALVDGTGAKKKAHGKLGRNGGGPRRASFDRGAYGYNKGHRAKKDRAFQATRRPIVNGQGTRCTKAGGTRGREGGARRALGLQNRLGGKRSSWQPHRITGPDWPKKRPQKDASRMIHRPAYPRRSPHHVGRRPLARHKQKTKGQGLASNLKSRLTMGEALPPRTGSDETTRNTVPTIYDTEIGKELPPRPRSRAGAQDWKKGLVIRHFGRLQLRHWRENV